jgi:hypothetical protein
VQCPSILQDDRHIDLRGIDSWRDQGKHLLRKKFFDASIAAKMPLLAARPGLKLLFIEPNDSRNPTGCDAARPSAQTICCSLRFNSLPTAAADPNTPAAPMMRQPTSIWFGYTALPIRHSVSTPSTSALRKSLPEKRTPPDQRDE